MLRLYTEILTSVWLIDPAAAQQLAPHVPAILKGETSDLVVTSGMEVQAGKNDNFAYIPPDGTLKWGQYTDVLPKGSIAVFYLKGVMMGDSQYCGPEGTFSIASRLKNAQANPNIVGAIIVANSPGGQLSGTEQLAKAINDFGKPTASVVQGMAASACYFAISQTDKIFLSGRSSMLGSIGTMIAFMDDTKRLESKGTVLHEIYATESTEKNKDFSEARKGNYNLLVQNTLDPANKIFHEAVIHGRGTKLDQSKDSKVLKGCTYMGQDAIDVGLADAFGDMEDAIAYIQKGGETTFTV